MLKNRKKIIVIGGGITGLSTAYFLQEQIKKRQEQIKKKGKQGIEAQMEILLIEGNQHLGGKVVSERIEDFVIEGGPDSFITQKKWGMELIRRLEMTDSLVQTDPVNKAIYILSKGKLVPMPQGFNLMVPGQFIPFLLSPLVSLPGKARMGMDLFIPKRSSNEDESIAAFVRRRLGQEAVQQFAEPILAGIFAGDAEKLSLQATFPQFAQLEKMYGSLIKGMWKRKSALTHKAPQYSLFVTLQEGLSSLISALRKKLEQVEIKTGHPVTHIAPLKEGYEIIAGAERFIGDALVVTTPTYKAADWISGWNAPLSSLLQEISYVSTATVSLGFHRKDVKHPLKGFGFVIPRREGSAIMASTWSSTKFPGRAPKDHVLIRVFMGGAYRQDLIDRDDDALIGLARKEMHSILGINAVPVVARAFRWIKANPQYHVGHLDLVSKIEAETQKHPGLFLTGAAYRGVGIPDCVQQGMETAEKIQALLFKQ